MSINILYYPYYTEILSRYYSDSSAGEKYNDPNFMETTTLKLCFEDDLKKGNLNVTKHIPVIFKSSRPIISSFIKNTGLFAEPVLFDIIKCIEFEQVKGHEYIISATLFELLTIIRYLDQQDTIYKDIKEVLSAISPDILFSVLNIEDIKGSRFIYNSDPVYKDDVDTILFIQDLSTLENTMSYNNAHASNPSYCNSKLYLTTIRIALNDYHDIDTFNYLLSNRSARMSISNDTKWIYITANIDDISYLCKSWKEFTKKDDTDCRIPFLYYCLKDTHIIHDMIKLEDDNEKELFHFLINDQSTRGKYYV